MNEEVMNAKDTLCEIISYALDKLDQDIEELRVRRALWTKLLCAFENMGENMDEEVWETRKN